MSGYDFNNEIFAESDVEQFSSSSFYETDEEEVVQEASSSSFVNNEWASTGELQSIPFTNVEHINSGSAESAYDYFNLIFNTTFMSILISSINIHAKQLLSVNKYDHSRIQNWKDITMDELQLFLGLLFHMGHIKLDKLNDYWKTDILFNLPFAQFMSRDRFLLILRNFCYLDSDLNTKNDNDPNIFVKPILTFFNNLMKTLITPSKNLTIDESIVLWHGRLNDKEQIQGKTQKHGVKLYALTDTSGITQKMHMNYRTRDLRLKGQGHADKVVMSLMADYLNAGYSLYMDKFYNSVPLAEKLLAKKTYVTGVLNATRHRNPDITKLEVGDTVSKYNASGVCVTNYRDKSNILMISTEHSPDLIEQINRFGEITYKPTVIVQYNRYRIGIDRRDQLLSEYLCYNKSTRWYKKILIHIMQIMLLNGFIMYNEQQKNKDSTKLIPAFYEFRLEIIRKLLNVTETRSNSTSSSKITFNGEDIHLPEELPRDSKGRYKRKDCRYCLETRKVRKATFYYCSLCIKKPGLCIKCFRSYHRY